MFFLPIPVPPQAVRRLPTRSLNPAPIQSVHSEIIVLCPTYTELAAWFATPHAESFLLVYDTYQILPYSSLEIHVNNDAPGGSGNAFLIWLYLTPADDTKTKAGVTLAGQLNTRIQQLAGLYPDMASMSAVPIADGFRLQMPWGMLGFTGYDDSAWFAEGQVSLGFPGVDVPLIYGILGPRRHVFAVTPPYQDDYYGTPDLG